MSRRWKVIWSFNLVFILLGILAVVEPDIRWLFLTHALGYITGLIVYSSGMDAEEREKKEWKFQDDVFMHYEGVRGSSIEHDGVDEESINKTAIHFDISPSEARNIVNIYVGHNDA